MRETHQDGMLTGPKVFGAKPISWKLRHDALIQALREKTISRPCRTDPSPGTESGKVSQGIGLFTKSVRLCRLPDTKIPRDGSRNPRGERLANKRPENDIVCDEDQIPIRLLVARISIL